MEVVSKQPILCQCHATYWISKLSRSELPSLSLEAELQLLFSGKPQQNQPQTQEGCDESKNILILFYELSQ